MLLLAPAHPVKAALVGDLDHNGVVDIYDVQLFSMVFGMTNSSPDWNSTIVPSVPSFTPSQADLNGDGVIDIFDVIILGSNFHP